MKTVLSAIVGSQAYGLATPESDIDRLGVFVLPTRAILGVFNHQETVVSNDPDVTRHEVGKFVHLALKCNPSLLELLWLGEYETQQPEGALLIGVREAFLSEPAVRNAFGGYAVQQARRLLTREAEGKRGFRSRLVNRREKHARHCFRLLNQGRELLETGTLSVKVRDPDELFRVASLSAVALEERFKREMAGYNDCRAVLPPKPDLAAVNTVLLAIREMNP